MLVVRLCGEELSELPVGRAGGKAAVSSDEVVELGSSVSVDSSEDSEGDAVTVTVVGAMMVPMLVVPGAVSVTVFSTVVVYVEPPTPPATATLSVSCTLVEELGVWLVRPDVTVATGRTVVVVCVLAQTQPTS